MSAPKISRTRSRCSGLGRPGPLRRFRGAAHAASAIPSSRAAGRRRRYPQGDDDADRQRGGGHEERDREPALGGQAGRGERRGHDPGRDLAPDRTADAAHDRVHAGRHAGLLGRHRLDDEVRHRAEREADPDAHHEHRDVDLPARAVGDREHHEGHARGERTQDERHLRPDRRREPPRDGADEQHPDRRRHHEEAGLGDRGAEPESRRRRQLDELRARG